MQTLFGFPIVEMEFASSRPLNFGQFDREWAAAFLGSHKCFKFGIGRRFYRKRRTRSMKGK